MLITAAVNFTVGLLIGWTGIAGFLLPIYFVGYLGLPAPTALAVSFFAFLISGIVGSYNYYRKGHINLRISLILSCGSLAGALIGVRLNLMIPPPAVKLVLYAVVLLSGISILLRKDGSGTTEKPLPAHPLLQNQAMLAAVGLTTGAICSISGAGGPILVMPLLVSFGMNIRAAVGISLLNSVFIALPAFLGYLSQVGLRETAPLLLLCGVSHAAGIFAGSSSAHGIPQKPLKTAVAFFSILIAATMLFRA